MRAWRALKKLAGSAGQPVAWVEEEPIALFLFGARRLSLAHSLFNTTHGLWWGNMTPPQLNIIRKTYL
jgi:hypothetical protein